MSRKLTHDEAVQLGSIRKAVAKYNALHARVNAERGQPTKCEVCGLEDPTRRYEWASLTKNYEDIEDYRRMCVPCHRKHDCTDKTKEAISAANRQRWQGPERAKLLKQLAEARKKRHA